jgi:hypothetical protein
MKKLLFTFPLCLTVIEIAAQNLSIGLIGGVGHSWTSVDRVTTSDTRLHGTYNIGGRLVYSFESNWGISGDVKFSSEGQTVGTSNKNKTAYRANYIRIPLQGIYFFGKFGDRVRPKVSLGPSFGILAGGKIKTFADGDKIASVKTKDYWKSFDYGVTLAAGGNVRIAPATWLNLDLSYYHGLADVTEVGPDGSNRNIGVNVGVTFPLATLRPEKIQR